jgi:hypothetical protein
MARAYDVQARHVRPIVLIGAMALKFAQETFVTCTNSGLINRFVVFDVFVKVGYAFLKDGTRLDIFYS